VTPSTRVVVVVAKYRLVVSVDVTPSMAAIDPVTGCVLFDQVLITLEKCLISLCDTPVELPGVDVQVMNKSYSWINNVGTRILFLMPCVLFM
jgi:hypothetical protein